MELLRLLVGGAIAGGLIGLAGVLGQRRRRRREDDDTQRR